MYLTFQELFLSCAMTKLYSNAVSLWPKVFGRPLSRRSEGLKLAWSAFALAVTFVSVIPRCNAQYYEDSIFPNAQSRLGPPWSSDLVVPHQDYLNIRRHLTGTNHLDNIKLIRITPMISHRSSIQNSSRPHILPPFRRPPSTL